MKTPPPLRTPDMDKYIPRGVLTTDSLPGWKEQIGGTGTLQNVVYCASTNAAQTYSAKDLKGGAS